MTTSKIAGVQMDIKFADKQGNLERMFAAFDTATAQKVLLTVFPECGLTGYCFDSLESALAIAETVPGPSVTAFADLCRVKNAYVILGLLEKEGGQLFNTLVLVGPQGVVGKYQKVHLPHLGVDRFTTTGKTGFGVFEVESLKVGMLICYDATFPEAARCLALQGADLIVISANYPNEAHRTPEFVVDTRALENHVYVLTVNRIGREGGFEFCGLSSLCDPSGDVLECCSSREATIIYGDIDPERSRQKHLIRKKGEYELDYFGDRKPQYYGGIVKT